MKYTVNYKKFALFSLILSALFAYSATTSAAPAPSHDTPKEVRFAYAGGPRVWILGKIDKSFDKAFGSEVKWIPFNSGADVLTLFAAKEIDIARFGSSPAVAGFSRKLPIELFGLEGLIATSERLIAKEGIVTLKDLEGKTVGFPPNSTAQYALEAAIAINKLNKSKINLVALKPAELVSAWERGDIDAAYVWGPFSQQLEAKKGHQLFATQDLKKDNVLVYNNFVVRKEFAEKYPQILVQFLKTYQEKVDQYQKDPLAASKLIAEHLNLDVQTVSTTLAGIEYISLRDQLTPAYFGHDRASTEKSGIAKATLDTAKFLVEIGELRKSDVPASFVPNINTHFLSEAVKP